MCAIHSFSHSLDRGVLVKFQKSMARHEARMNDTHKPEEGGMNSNKTNLLRLMSSKSIEGWCLVAASCVQTSKAAGLHCTWKGVWQGGRGQCRLGLGAWGGAGGGRAHPVNLGHKSSQNGEARGHTSEEELLLK